MSGSARYRIREPEVAVETFDGEAIIIDFGSGSYFSVSRTAAEVLDMIAAGQAVGDIVTFLETEYPSAANQIADDVRHLIDLLLEEQLIVARQQPADTRRLPPAPSEQTYEPPQIDKFEDMQELLLLDPIHEVDQDGWPRQRKAA